MTALQPAAFARAWVFDGHINTDPVTPAISPCASTPLLTTPTCTSEYFGCSAVDP